MADRCCVKDCERTATIRQPLRLGAEMVLHMPLCEHHSTKWQSFVGQLIDARKRATIERRDAAWLMDAALSLALFPPGEPL